MINKVIKVMLIVIMIFGIAFSISNFIFPGKIHASSKDGVWDDFGGDIECVASGKICSTGGSFEV